MRPLIGIASCLDDRGRWRPGRDYHYADASYAVAVEASGGTPVYLPSVGDPSEVAARIDGLLVPGGDDFPPSSAYPPSVRFDPTPVAQLDFDATLLRSALARDLPVLAICYGMQLLALELGGELLYDIPTDAPGAQPHQLTEPDGRHGIRLESGSRLAEVIGDAPGPVNSLHHQGVARCSEALRVSARADDGLIEAVERPGSGFCLGVQWHPEKLGGRHREGLFGAFVHAALGPTAG